MDEGGGLKLTEHKIHFSPVQCEYPDIAGKNTRHLAKFEWSGKQYS